MGKRKDALAPGEFYHIFNRGNSKQVIFLDDFDRERFTKLLYLCNSRKSFNFRDDIVDANINAWDFEAGEKLVSIGAWVLMPNHFHLYLTVPHSLNLVKGENGKDKNISLFLEKLTRAYSRYFNTKYNRTGSLFEGRFKSVHIATDPQAKYLFSYIHLNPLKLINTKWRETGIGDTQKAWGYLNTYKWSSFLDYAGVSRQEKKILNSEDFFGYFDSPETFKKEIFDWFEIISP
ncbi:MAG: transposase [Candidatus Paceibacterota bacterium]